MFKLNDSVVTHSCTDAGFLSEEGQDEVKDILSRYNVHVPSGWDWSWKAECNNGTYTGSLTKRLCKLLYRETKDAGCFQPVSLNDKSMGRLGSLLGEHCSIGPEDYHFRFVNEWHNRRGDFHEQDENCYFGIYRASRTILSNHNVKLVQFFDGPQIDWDSMYLTGDDEHHVGEPTSSSLGELHDVILNGKGRAWMLPIKTRFYNDGRDPSLKVAPSQEAANLWLVCNGYGIQTPEVSRVLADYWGMSYRRTVVKNSVSRYYPWVNGEKGYLIGMAEKIHRLPELPRVTLNWPEAERCREFNSQCYELLMCRCGKEVWSDQLGSEIFEMADPNWGSYECYACRYYADCRECGIKVHKTLPCFVEAGICVDCRDERIEAEAIQTSLEEAEEAENES